MVDCDDTVSFPPAIMQFQFHAERVRQTAGQKCRVQDASFVDSKMLPLYLEDFAVSVAGFIAQSWDLWVIKNIENYDFKNG